MSFVRLFAVSTCVVVLAFSSAGSFAQQQVSARAGLVAPGNAPARSRSKFAVPISLSFNASGGPTLQALAWNWGVSNSGTTHNPGGEGSGKPSFQDVAVTKYTDQLTPVLVEYVATGARLSEVILTQGSLVLRMKGVIVTSVSMGGSSQDDGVATENLTLNFAAFIMSVTAVAAVAAVAAASPLAGILRRTAKFSKENSSQLGAANIRVGL